MKFWMPRSVLAQSFKTAGLYAAGALLAMLSLRAVASAQLNTPSAGIIRCDDGTVRKVLGIDRSFLLGPALASSATAASFSDAGGLISVQGELRLLLPDGSPAATYQSGEKFPVPNLDGPLTTAIAWLPAAQAILYWNGSGFVKVTLPSPVDGTVTSIKETDQTAELLVLADGAVSAITIDLASGNQLSSRLLPGIGSAAFQQQQYIAYLDERGLEFETADGTRRLVQVPAGGIAVERMASDWLHLTSLKTGRHWALHAAGTGWQLSELPARGGK